MKQSLGNLQRTLSPAALHYRRLPASSQAQAQKGFGTKEENPTTNDKSVATKGRKGKKFKQRTSNPGLAPSQLQPNSREEKFLQKLDKVRDGSDAEDQAFQKRLESLKQKAQASKMLQRENDDSQDSGPLSFSPLESARRDEPKRKEEAAGSSFGVPKAAAGILSLLLVGIFVATSGFGPSGSPPTKESQRQSSSPLPSMLKDWLIDSSKASSLPRISQAAKHPSDIGSQPEVRQAVQSKVEELEKVLSEKPEDTDAKQSLSDLVTVLGDYRRARTLAEQVVQAEPQNSRAWLILAEARSRLLDLSGAALAYQRSLETSDQPSLTQLQGLAGALANDKKHEEAIRQLQKYESVAGRSEVLGSVDLQLLIGKVYSQWDRHFASALAVYDGIIEKYPNDFRGYLARGALFKENGRKADAQRMFIQARYFAPPEARAIVEQIANR